VDRQPLLLLVCSTSLLSVVLLARNVRGLPDRLSTVVETRKLGDRDARCRCGKCHRHHSARRRLGARSVGHAPEYPLARGRRTDSRLFEINAVSYAKKIVLHCPNGYATHPNESVEEVVAFAKSLKLQFKGWEVQVVEL
jgi:hypothetical protein